MPDALHGTFTADGMSWTDASLWAQFNALHASAPQALALLDAAERHWSRDEIHQLAKSAAQTLLQHGIEHADRVLLEGRKSAPTLAVALAISSLGAIICPFAPDLGQAERQVLEDRLGHVALISRSVGQSTTMDDLPGLPGMRLALRQRPDSWQRDPRDAQTALIGFTSGTTGVPKGVMHSSAAMNYTVRACAHVAGLEAGDAILGVVPLGSAPGFTFTAHCSLALGHPLIIVDPWDPLRALSLMAKYACRWGICVPTHLLAMIETAKSGQWSRHIPLKALGVGGSAMTSQMVADAAELLGIPVLRMFGMSECMGHASTRLGDDLETRLHSDGTPFPGTQDEAFDASNHVLPRGQRGQAGVRGPSLFTGYCQGMGDEHFQLTDDGYFLTGDEIICTDGGALKVVGRIKDQIIRGGYNIDPAEVEAALLRHPAIAEIAVVAVPEPKLGEQACAVYCIRDGHEPLVLSDIKEHLTVIGLTKKKWPEHLLKVDGMQYTATGKIDKKRMAKQAVSALGLG